MSEFPNAVSATSEGFYEYDRESGAWVARKRWTGDVEPLVALYSSETMASLSLFAEELGESQAIRARYLALGKKVTRALSRGVSVDVDMVEAGLESAWVRATAEEGGDDYASTTSVTSATSATSASSSTAGGGTSVPSDISPWAEFDRSQVILRGVVHAPSVVLPQTTGEGLEDGSVPVLEIGVDTLFVSNESNTQPLDLSVHETDAVAGGFLVRLLTLDPVRASVRQAIDVVTPFSTRVKLAYKGQGSAGLPHMVLTGITDPIRAELSVNKAIVCTDIVQSHVTSLMNKERGPGRRDAGALTIVRSFEIQVEALDAVLVSDYAEKIALVYVFGEALRGTGYMAPDLEFEAGGQIEIMANNVNFEMPETVLEPLIVQATGRVAPWDPRARSLGSRIEVEVQTVTAPQVVVTKEVIRQLMAYVSLFQQSGERSDFGSHFEYVLVNETEDAVVLRQALADDPGRTVGPGSQREFAFVNPFLPRVVEMEWLSGWVSPGVDVSALSHTRYLRVTRGVDVGVAESTGLIDPGRSLMPGQEEVLLGRSVTVEVDTVGLRKVVRVRPGHTVSNKTPVPLLIRCVNGPESGKARVVAPGAEVALVHDAAWDARWQVSFVEPSRRTGILWSSAFGWGDDGSVVELNLGVNGADLVLAMFSGQTGSRAAQLSFVVPLVIVNETPFPLLYSFGAAEGRGRVDPDGSRYLFVRGLEKQVSFSLGPWGPEAWTEPLELHTPMMQRSRVGDAGELSVRVNTRLARGVGARSVFVSLPFILVNRTELPLSIRQAGGTPFAVDAHGMAPFAWQNGGEGGDLPRDRRVMEVSAATDDWVPVDGVLGAYGGSHHVVRVGRHSFVQSVEGGRGGGRVVVWKPRVRVVNNVEDVEFRVWLGAGAGGGGGGERGGGEGGGGIAKAFETLGIVGWDSRLFIQVNAIGATGDATGGATGDATDDATGGVVWSPTGVSLDELEAKHWAIRLSGLRSGMYEYVYVDVTVTVEAEVTYVVINPPRSTSSVMVVNRGRVGLVVRAHATGLEADQLTWANPEEWIYVAPGGGRKSLWWPHDWSSRRVDVAVWDSYEDDVVMVPPSRLPDDVGEWGTEIAPFGVVVVDGRLVQVTGSGLALDWSSPLSVDALGSGSIEWVFSGSQAQGYGSINRSVGGVVGVGVGVSGGGVGGSVGVEGLGGVVGVEGGGGRRGGWCGGRRGTR